MSSYHGWTHAPKAQGGTDPIPTSVGVVPCFRAYYYNAATLAISNNSDANLRFDRWQTSDVTIFDAAPYWIAGTPDYIERVDILERGLYAFTIQVNFNATLNAGDEIGISIEDAGTTYTGPPMNIQSAAIKAGDGTTGSWSWTHIQSFPPIWANDSGGANANIGQSPDLPQVKIKMFNLTGSSINIDEAYLEIHQLWAFDYDTLRSGGTATTGAIQSQA